MSIKRVHSSKPLALPSQPEYFGVMLTIRVVLALIYRDLLVTMRQFVTFLIQVVLQPLFLLFVFGRILPSIGLSQANFVVLFLPGVVALTIVLTAMQGVALPLVADLGFTREIDDRLLAPVPLSLIAIEKIVIGMLRSLIAGTLIFPLAYWILGSGYQVRTDDLGMLIGLMLLIALANAALGIVIGTFLRGELVSVVFTLLITPLFFTGCVYYPWRGLATIRWFQILTLFNPLTYASEGLRYSMLPASTSDHFPTMGIGWCLLGLGVSSVIFLLLGLWGFQKRVVG